MRVTNLHFNCRCAALSVMVLLAGLVVGEAADLAAIALPRPQTDGGRPLMQVLKERKSTREFSDERLSPQQLSNLLWAAFGISRTDGKRTAPSAMNRQSIDLYVALGNGAYRYDAAAHRLIPVAGGDLRAHTGTQAFVSAAFLNLIYVADYARMGNAKPEDKDAFANVESGFIGQNVYLFCASEGLGTVFRASLNRDALARDLALRPDQRITYAQTVGYPKK